MAQVDVERTLTEIRERVRAKIRQQTAATPSTTEATTPVRASEVAIESLRANLAIVERSWNRLPPITTYRRGSISGLELWLKRLLKKATHWFTWEQVNFNSATGNSIKDILAILLAHQQEVMELRRELEKYESMASERGSNSQAQLTAKHLDSTHDPAVTSSSKVADESASDRYQQLDSDITDLARRIEELRTIRARHDIT
jgi:hypothetical protein